MNIRRMKYGDIDPGSNGLKRIIGANKQSNGLNLMIERIMSKLFGLKKVGCCKKLSII